MVVFMDMSSGKRLDEISAYNDEVLNANWMPREALQLGLQSALASTPRRVAASMPPPNVDAFLRTIYLSQE